MFVPDPVISLSLKPKGLETPNFSRALNRFQKEDPTFKVHIDQESKEVSTYFKHYPAYILTESSADYYLWNGRTPSGNLCRTYEARVTTWTASLESRKSPSVRPSLDKLISTMSTRSRPAVRVKYAKVIGSIEPMEMDRETNKGCRFRISHHGRDHSHKLYPCCREGKFGCGPSCLILL